MNRDFKRQQERGITLIALIVSLIVLLILAAISLSSAFDERGIFKRTEDAAMKFNQAKAREVLETVLLADGQYEKNLNPGYNENEFLNELIKKEIPGTEIIGDVAIVGGWGFELDRSVPKIGRPLGKKEDIVFPRVEATVKIADNKKSATIHITAEEKVHGIEKIEIWLLGEKIKEYKYEKEKQEITVEPPYIAPQNGEYTIKAISDLWSSTTVKVEGIVASVEFEPNGNEEWQTSQTTRVTIKETNEKVTNAKYQWTESVTEPNFDGVENTFKSGDTITKDGVTGTYYLWTMLETTSGELKWRSEGFNIDNKGPEVEITSTPVSYTSFTLEITARDEESGVVEYQIFIDNAAREPIKLDSSKKSDTQTVTIDGVSYGSHNCYVIVKDKLGNPTRKDITAKTLEDTTGPTIISFDTEKYSADGITLTATAKDTGTGTKTFEFYVDDELKATKPVTVTTENVTESVTIEGLTMGAHNCKVIVKDAKENPSTPSTKTGTTKQHTWEKWTAKKKYEECIIENYRTGEIHSSTNCIPASYIRIYNPKLNESTGRFSYEEYDEREVTPRKGDWFRYQSNEGPIIYKVIDCGKKTVNNTSLYYYTFEGHSSKQVGTKVENTNQDVTGTSINDYPEDGYDEATNFYYIYKGII